MTTDTRKGRVPSASQVPCWQWLITQYLISWDPITYYAECRTNKLKSTVTPLIDDTPNPAFVCSNVLMLVTTTKAWLDNAVCHPDGELLVSYLSHKQTLIFGVCVCVFRCMRLFVACIPKYICCFDRVCLCEYIVKHIGGICQAVDPVKGEFPLFTLRPSWFAINKNKGIINDIMLVSLQFISSKYCFNFHLSQLIKNWRHISKDQRDFHALN